MKIKREKQSFMSTKNYAEALVWCGVVWCGVVWCGVVWCSLRVENITAWVQYCTLHKPF